MSDSETPLIPPQSESASRPASLDETIEQCIGDFSWAQFGQVLLVSLAWMFDSQQTFISVFTDPPIISEFGLESASSLIKGLPASSFFVGCLVGGFILASLADSSSLGRKNMLFLSCLIMSLSTFFTIFSTNVWIYSLLRFISGYSSANVGTSAIVLSTELVGKRFRGQVGTFGFFFFTLGFLSVPGIAYINRDSDSSWRSMYVWMSTPTFIYSMLVLIFACESPRWLFLQGKVEEALSVLKTISPINEIDISKLALDSETSISKSNAGLFSAIEIVIERKWAVKRLLAVTIIAIGQGMVYYGMPLALRNLPFNLYLSVTLNILSELPNTLVVTFFISKMNRRVWLICLTSLSGICSVTCALVGEFSSNLQIGLEIVSFFSAGTAYDLLLIYTLELFPTCVRNLAVSMVEQAILLGGVFGPILVAAGSDNQFLSFGVFGLMIGICGLFAVGLPETRDSTISDTMEEEEYKETTTSNVV